MKVEEILAAVENRLRGSVKDLLIKRIKSEHKVFIGDTTLRDGEQSPGASLTVDQKLEIATQLERLGVDSIEAGFPISSKEDFQATRIIAQRVRRPVITALCRSRREDIDSAREAFRGSRRWALALFLGTSPILRRYSLKMTKEAVLGAVSSAIRYARRFTDNVAFGAEDASRTEADFLYKVYEAAIREGALVVGYTDTVGWMTPGEVGDAITAIKTNVPNIDKAFIAVHFHDDLGLAVANALAAIKSGVSIVQCTINGIGERAGNTSLEEFVMALKIKKDFYRAKIHINTRELYKTSRLVSKLTGMAVSPNKAVVGENVFASEAGIHQAALMRSRDTYEIIKPESVGQKGTRIVLGRHSGKHALVDRIRKMRLRLPGRNSDAAASRIYEMFKKVAAEKKVIEDRDIIAIVKTIAKEI